MKKIYIFPELGSNCSENSYKNLSQALKKLDYQVILIKPDWFKPISNQIFKIDEDAIVFGFSMGAVLAYLSICKYRCRFAIFASMSPIYKFTIDEYAVDLFPYMSRDDAYLIARDLKNITIDMSKIEAPYITISGENENMDSDIYVSNTGHELNDNYIENILKIIKNPR